MKGERKAESLAPGVGRTPVAFGNESPYIPLDEVGKPVEKTRREVSLSLIPIISAISSDCPIYGELSRITRPPRGAPKSISGNPPRRS
ncbi:unnamed protein product [Caenorhabditis nigoni]